MSAYKVNDESRIHDALSHEHVIATKQRGNIPVIPTTPSGKSVYLYQCDLLPVPGASNVLRQTERRASYDGAYGTGKLIKPR